MKPVVSIVMGSRSDLPTMKATGEVLKEFGLAYEIRIMSAHRTPEAVEEYAKSAKDRGIQVIIAAAGGAAHLAGVTAASTTLSLIGVLMRSKALNRLDSLLSIVQMPGGIPVATVAIGSAGAKNAGILAAQMIALADEAMAQKLVAYKQAMKEKVLADSIVVDFE